jgi:hypothetical protein
MATVRSRTLNKVREERAKHGTSLVGRTLQVIIDTLTHEDAHTIWTGMWTPEVQEAIAARCPWTLKAREYGQVVAALRHLSNGLLDLMKITEGETVRTRRKKERTEGRQVTLQELWRVATVGRAPEAGTDPRGTDGRHLDG